MHPAITLSPGVIASLWAIAAAQKIGVPLFDKKNYLSIDISLASSVGRVTLLAVCVTPLDLSTRCPSISDHVVLTLLLTFKSGHASHSDVETAIYLNLLDTGPIT